MKKSVSLVLVFILMLSFFCGCSDKKDNTQVKDAPKSEDYVDKMTDKNNPVAIITMQDGGAMVVELYYDKAPNTVKNFISLAKKGFYDGLTFHRVIPGFMIQGGDPKGNGTGNPGYSIFGEFENNNFHNDIKHVRGTISMARSTPYNSAGSQFFIMVADASYLDGDYAAFGKCIYGMDVADSIVSVKTNSNDKPLEDVIIKSVTISDNGVTYDEPETIM